MKIVQITTDNRNFLGDRHSQVPCFGTAPTALLEGFAELEGVEVHIISCASARMEAPTHLAGNIYFHQPVVPKWGWGRSLFIGCAMAARKIIRRIDPDLVHGQGTERDCAMSAVLSGYPNVLTIHGIMRAVAKTQRAKRLSYYGMASALERFVVGRTAGVFCNSAYTESEIAPFARQTWRVPNAIRSDFFAPFPDEATRTRRVVILGSILHYKQPLEILKMWRALAERYPDVLFTFVGRSGSDRYSHEFRDLVADPVLRGKAEHIEWLEADELIPLLDSARGMIHFPTEESFGLAVAEGLARNLKLFAARTGGVPDVAAGCEGVEFFAADDWDGLTKGVTAWIAQGMEIPNSAPPIRRRFSPHAVARQHLAIYQEFLGR